jgi:hypothetical protein
MKTGSNFFALCSFGVQPEKFLVVNPSHIV